jgi:hypothetical protein
MAVVLDARVAAGVALQDRTLTKHVEQALESGKCYMTLASVVEFSCLVTDGCGPQLARQWLGWLFTNEDIEIVERLHLTESLTEEFQVLVGEAYLKSGVAYSSASAAALAHRMGIPVLTNRREFRELEDQQFCGVQWAVE